MWKQKLCMMLNGQFGASEEEQIKLMKQVGFDGFFTSCWQGRSLQPVRQMAEKYGMYFQSVHAPYERMYHIWYEDADTAAALEELLYCVRETAGAGVPIMVLHAFIGFEDHTPTEFGLQNIEKVVQEAKKYGVRLAFENTEGEEYLAAILNRFSEDHIGFCWDTGHEMCYNHGKDMLALYGDRLMCTHLNDNLGIRDREGRITWLDDLHLLPYDGAGDWDDIARRLANCGYGGELTFELNTKSKPDRHENDGYDRMALVDYLTEAYKRACRFGMAVCKYQTRNAE